MLLSVIFNEKSMSTILIVESSFHLLFLITFILICCNLDMLCLSDRNRRGREDFPPFDPQRRKRSRSDFERDGPGNELG